MVVDVAILEKLLFCAVFMLGFSFGALVQRMVIDADLRKKDEAGPR